MWLWNNQIHCLLTSVCIYPYNFYQVVCITGKKGPQRFWKWKWILSTCDYFPNQLFIFCWPVYSKSSTRKVSMYFRTDLYSEKYQTFQNVQNIQEHPNIFTIPANTMVKLSMKRKTNKVYTPSKKLKLTPRESKESVKMVKAVFKEIPVVFLM